MTEIFIFIFQSPQIYVVWWTKISTSVMLPKHGGAHGHRKLTCQDFAMLSMLWGLARILLRFQQWTDYYMRVLIPDRLNSCNASHLANSQEYFTTSPWMSGQYVSALASTIVNITELRHDKSHSIPQNDHNNNNTLAWWRLEFHTHKPRWFC